MHSRFYCVFNLWFDQCNGKVIQLYTTLISVIELDKRKAYDLISKKI